MHTLSAQDFEGWRNQARDLLALGVLPHDVSWQETLQESLFAEASLPSTPTAKLTVTKAFMTLAKVIACHRDSRRWDLLYQLLFRLKHGETHLMRITTDPLMHALLMMEKSVRRDAHKMKAFVRFRLVNEDGNDHYIAWHRPDHRIVQLVAPFFARRFAVMEWTILTPDESAHWDGKRLSFGPGVPASEAPQADALEDAWRTYYRATFNPARIKLATMKREMPLRHWRTLPETDIIADMLAEAPARVEKMIAYTEGTDVSARDFMPDIKDLEHLAIAARSCEGCELYKPATQTVFGEGNPQARIMLVGEQPGNDEDLGGRPFIGPAGDVLDEALSRAGLQRADIYITNAVKHFRFLYQESFRQHRAPSRYHTQACRPWLDAEIKAIQPQAIVCLGNTAARTLIDPGFAMKTRRGQWSGDKPALLGTFHPSSILRARGTEKQQQMESLVHDLSNAASYVAKAA